MDSQANIYTQICIYACIRTYVRMYVRIRAYSMHRRVQLHSSWHIFYVLAWLAWQVICEYHQRPSEWAEWIFFLFFQYSGVPITHSRSLSLLKKIPIVAVSFSHSLNIMLLSSVSLTYFWLYAMSFSRLCVRFSLLNDFADSIESDFKWNPLLHTLSCRLLYTYKLKFILGLP